MSGLWVQHISHSIKSWTWSLWAPFSSESSVIHSGPSENIRVCMFRKNRRKGFLFFLTVLWKRFLVKKKKNLGHALFFICKCNGKCFLLVNCSAIPAVVIPQCKGNSIIRCKNLRNIRNHLTKIRTSRSSLFSDCFVHLNPSLCIPALPIDNWQLDPLATPWREWCRA